MPIPPAPRVARESYGRQVAFLARQSRDVAAAEHARSEAFAAALLDWPKKAVPRNPQARLMTVAKPKTIERLQKLASSNAASDHLLLHAEALQDMAGNDRLIPDERLTLMFACAHPAIDPAIRIALILPTLLGLDAAEIGSAFLVMPAAMGQQLARAKNKIKLAGIAFGVPDLAQRPARLDSVLAAIYAAHATG